MNSKENQRAFYRNQRRNVLPYRRIEAQKKVVEILLPKLQKYPFVLSFASKEEEIDLWPINQVLADEKRLLLPRILKEEIIPHCVPDLNALFLHPTWNVLEPDPFHCPVMDLESVSLVLVPGVAFDIGGNRLGYGKGHYDRFLNNLKGPFWGIGFKEQEAKMGIYVEPHDVPLSQVFLF